jgi:hypothetical protein
VHYAKRGYRAIPLDGKDAWLRDMHGAANGTDPHPDVEWLAGQYWSHNIGLVVPRGCLVVDVDIHDAKHGDRAILDALNGRWLPPAPQGSARRARSKRHGHYWSRDPLPPGSWPRDLGPDSAVEIVRPGEYVVAPPSIHPKTRERYRLYGGPAGHEVDWRAMPRPEDLPLMPEEVALALVKYAAGRGRKPRASRVDWAASGGGWESVKAWLELADPDSPTCKEMARRYAYALGAMEKAGVGGRHQTVLEQQFHLIMTAGEGHCGLGQALHGLYAEWQQLEPRDGMSDMDWCIEFFSALDRPLAAYTEKQDAAPCACLDAATYALMFGNE